MTKSAIIFTFLLTAHLLTDFILQTEKDVARKAEPLVFIRHLLLTSLTAYVVLGDWYLWQVIPIIFILHGIIDALKLIVKKRIKNNSFTIFFMDQILHLFSLLVITGLFSADFTNSLWLSLFGNYFNYFLIGISALILITKAGSISVELFVKPLLEQMDNFENRGFINGGKIIGYLERFLIVLFVYSGNFPGVGFLIAAKSIFRFGELFNSKNRKEAEYIIIGTFFSFAFALVTGFLFRIAASQIVK